MKKIYRWLLLLAFWPIAFADDLPDLGEVAQTVLTPLQEQQIGEEIMREVASSGEVLNDIEVVDYLNALGNRLASNGPDITQKFSFFVVEDNSINAFALPGGVIGVHTGLILTAGSESELASVLAHEIGHVVQRHMARMMAQQKQDAWKSYAAMAFALLAARSSPQLATAGLTAATAGAYQSQLNYTRDHEREADRVGLQILNQSGFDTRAMPAFFEQLLKGTRFIDGAAPAFLRTHPLTTERIADIRNRVEQLPYRQAVDSPDFNFTKAKVRALEGKATQAVDWFQTILKERKYSNEESQRYGLAVALIRNNKLQAAREQVVWLQNNALKHPMIETLAASLEVADHHPQAASNVYRTAMSVYPGYRGLIYGNTDNLIALGKAGDAIHFIEDKQVLYPQDAHLFELKSQAYTMLGNHLLRHQAQAEAYYLNYNLPGAIEQLELALKNGQGDFYQMSIVEARLKQLRQMLKDRDPKGRA